jgi:uncharacterized protein (DUF433 family)
MAETASRPRWRIDAPAVDEATAEAPIAKHIEPNPHRRGRHHARIAGRGVAVWALIGYLRDATVAETARDYELPEEAVLAAIAYYSATAT